MNATARVDELESLELLCEQGAKPKDTMCWLCMVEP